MISQEKKSLNKENKLKNNIMQTKELKENYKLAGDVNRDGDISPLDYVKVKNHIMGVKNISI